MRLTLRTLLAYLDDILEPAQARDMGAKVEESGMAQSMVNRIHEVMRRRRLLAPDVEGPGMGVDPNVVAEYLDNTLPSGDVADVEKVCLESDIHLAEVAACHQILTLVLGEPVEVVPRSRERMYALGPLAHTAAPPAGKSSESASPARGSNGSRVAAVEVPAPAATNGKRTESSRANGESRPVVVPITAASGAAAAPTGADRIPEYLRSKPTWQRALPWFLGAGLIGTFAFLLISDPDLGLRKPNSGDANRVASSDGKRPAGGAAPDDEVEFGVPVPATHQDETVASVPLRPPVARTPEAGNPVEAASIDPPPPVEPSEAKPAIPVPPPPDPGKTKPVGEAKVEVAENAVPVAPPPGGDVGAKEPAKDAVSLKYASAEGVLLHFRPKSGDWFLLPRRSLIHAGETIAAPDPFESILSIDEDRATATLLAGTVATIVGPTDAALVGFDIRQGRLIIQNKTVDDDAAANQQPESIFSLVLGKGTWKVELKGSGATCGIDIAPKDPEGFEQNLGAATWSGRIYLTAGAAAVTEPTGRRVTLEAMHALPLEPVTEEVKLNAAVPTETPRWMDASSRRLSTTARRNATLFEKEFDPAQSVALTVAALVNNPSVQQAELATKTLGLTQNYPALVKALSQSPHKEVRMTAISGLRTWLGASPKHGPLLAAELSKNFSPGDDTVIYELLWGFSQDEAKDADKSSQLVDRLESEQLAVRELAFYHLHRITTMKYEYDAQLPPAQRQLSVNRWRTHLKREGGALLKK